MGHEQVDLNLGSSNDKDQNPSGIPVIPYSETLPKANESDEDYATRMFKLTKQKFLGEITIGEPTQEDINLELELAKLERIKVSTNAMFAKSKMTARDKANIDQMESRPDLDYYKKGLDD
jgi:hypothetical protein